MAIAIVITYLLITSAQSIIGTERPAAPIRGPYRPSVRSAWRRAVSSPVRWESVSAFRAATELAAGFCARHWRYGDVSSSQIGICSRGPNARVPLLKGDAALLDQRHPEGAVDEDHGTRGQGGEDGGPDPQDGQAGAGERQSGVERKASGGFPQTAPEWTPA